MILAIAFAHVWGVIQLIILGSLTRTVRMRTVLAAVAVGLYAIGPLTVFLQVGWIHLGASLLGTPIAQLQNIASYTVDPFLEEALKLLPLVLLLRLVPSIRRQWSVMDCVLIAAATGSGYGLAENLYRYAGSPDSAQAIAGGWEIVIGRFTILVPGILHSLTSWLPAGTVSVNETIRVNSHLVWSALGGLAVGLLVRYPTRAARLIAGGLLFYIGLDHAAGNAALSSGNWLSPFTGLLHALATLGGLMVLATVAVAWWLDRPAPSADAGSEPLLQAEAAATPQINGTLKAAMSRLPWSLPWVAGFARSRRAYRAARAAGPPSPDRLLETLVAERDRIDRQLTQTESPPLLPSGLTPAALRTAVRRPAVIIALVCLAPSILYLVIGGFPQTAGLQAMLRGPVLWPVILLITVLAQARLAWTVIAGARSWSRTSRLPIGDDAAIAGLQLACAVGAVGLAGYTLTRVLGGVPAGSRMLSSAHGADAANRVTPENGASVANSAGAFAPPPASPELPDAARPSAPSAPSAPAANASGGPPPPPAPQPPAPAPAPKPNPYDAAAADAAARAAQADADALEAQEFRRKAVNALDSAEIAQRTADPADDPDVAAARERTRVARNAAAEADRNALDGDDPWDPDAPNKTAADMFHKEAAEAEAAQREAESAFYERKAAEVEQAKAAAGVAERGEVDAATKAAEAREAAENAHAAAARAADPLGAAADDAARNYADAQARAAHAFQSPDAKGYHDARQAAELAREQAEKARAAADAAHKARAGRIARKDDP